MKLLFFGWLLLVSSLTLAQKTGSDVLYKIDRTSNNVKIDELTDTDIVYFEPTAPKLKKTIARSQVWKIVFSDGSIEIITAQPGDASTNQAASQAKPINDNAPIADEVKQKSTSSGDYSAPSASSSYIDPKSFTRIHLTVGPEFAYYPTSTNTQWGDVTSGLGMNQNIGGSLRFDYRLIRSVAISLTAGYSHWELVRHYLQSGTEKYDETIQLTRIPVQAGFKLYVGKSFYLMPEGGVNLLTTSVKTSTSHPNPASQESKSTPVTYGISIGYEIRVGKLLVDLSGRYQFLDVKNLDFGTLAPALSERIQFASLRLGIGFNALRK